MGKQSSTKKVARAARAGGGRSSLGQQRNLLFPSVLVLIVVLGTALVVFARQDRIANADDSPPQLGDHIHLSYGIFVCDAYLPDLGEFESQAGIHTHGDGVIHAHPFSSLATGRNATLGLFLEAAGLELTDESLTLNGEEREEGEKCGEDDAIVQVLRWDDLSDEEPTRLTGDLSDIRLDTDGAALAIAFAPLDAEVPKPASFENLSALGAADSGQTAPGESTTSSTEATGESTSSTTAPADSSTSSSTTP